jgi:dTDP-4-amino-4,6-dideoxygalactose transaminase
MGIDKLAIDGGAPVRGSDDPLPQVYPRAVGANALKYYQELVASGLTKAPDFDRAFAEANGAKFALSVANCTIANHVSCAACGVGPGDEVVVSPITDYGTIYGIIAQRAIPVFADTDRLTGNVTAETIEPVITGRTRALSVVHWAGITCDMDAIVRLAQRRGLPIIEDVCQAPLAEYDGRKAGTLGAMGCFSFDGEKHLSCGSGGAIVTDDEELYNRCVNFAGNRGAYVDDPGYGRRHKVLGCNYRFDNVRMPLAMAQLEELPALVERRRELGAQLSRLIAEIDGVTPSPVPPRGDAVYWIYPFIIEVERMRAGLLELARAMAAEGLPGIGPGWYYLVPDSHDLLNDLRRTYGPGAVPGGASDGHFGRSYAAADTPNAKWYVDHMLRFPFTEKHSERDIEDIARIIRKVTSFYQA